MLAHAGGLLGLSALATTWNWGSAQPALSPRWAWARTTTGHAAALPDGAPRKAHRLRSWSGPSSPCSTAMRAARERELRVAQLEASLARAQLQNLHAAAAAALPVQRAQHHLVGDVRRSGGAADRDVGAAVGAAAGQRCAPREAQECRWRRSWRRWTAIWRCCAPASATDSRGGRVDDPTAAPRWCPSMVLQPLVENAMQHGGRPRGPGARGRAVTAGRRSAGGAGATTTGRACRAATPCTGHGPRGHGGTAAAALRRRAHCGRRRPRTAADSA